MFIINYKIKNFKINLLIYYLYHKNTSQIYAQKINNQFKYI